jgi:hypothetical protein
MATALRSSRRSGAPTPHDVLHHVRSHLPDQARVELTVNDKDIQTIFVETRKKKQVMMHCDIMPAEMCDSSKKVGLNIEDEEERRKLEKLKTKFERHKKFMKEVMSDKETIMKAQTMRDNSTTSHIMEINLKHFIMNKLQKKVAADKSDKTVHDTIWLLFDTFQFFSGFNFDEPTHFAGCTYRVIRFVPHIKFMREVLSDKVYILKVAADTSDKTVQDTIWLLFDTFQLISGIN